MNTRRHEPWPTHRLLPFATPTALHGRWNAKNALIPGGGSVGILEEGLAGRGRFSSCASSVQVEDALLAGAGLGPYMTIQVETDAPKWLPLTVLERMNELLELQPNWDSYGARCLKEQAFETALEILGTVMRPNTSPPTVVPTVEGGIQLEWHQNDIDLEVEVKPEGQVLMFRQGGSQPEVSDVDISLEFRGLVDTIDNLEAVSP